MKLLLDQNLSPLICARLAEAGIEAVHVRDVGLTHASDAEIVTYARHMGTVIVSQDSDFTSLLVRDATAHPSLILLRIQHAVTAADISALLVANLDAVADHLRSGAIVSLTNDSIRVRRLPIGRDDPQPAE